MDEALAHDAANSYVGCWVLGRVEPLSLVPTLCDDTAAVRGGGLEAQLLRECIQLTRIHSGSSMPYVCQKTLMPGGESRLNHSEAGRKGQH